MSSEAKVNRNYEGAAKLSSPTLLTLRHPEKNPPVPAIALAAFSGADLDLIQDKKLGETDQPVLVLPLRDTLSNGVDIYRYLTRSAKDTTLNGVDILSSIQVDYWLDFARFLVNGVGLQAVCATVNDYLALRTYLAGHQLTAADVVCWARLAGALQWEGLKKTGNFPHLDRWYNHIGSIPTLRDIQEKYYPKRNNVRKKQIADTIKEKKADPRTASARHTDAKFDIGLGPEWTGKVVTRFPPEPSGFLHVGHAKALILNQEIASANGGRMLIRFDDTNPDKEKDMYMESILADCGTLGADNTKVTYTSDYFPQMLDLAERLIKAGHLYADDTPQERMKEDRMAKQPSPKRDISTEESLRIWKEMKAGSQEGFKNCLRFRIDPANDNGTLRDPVAYRCNATPHLRTGTTYKVYPTYDCACPFVDSLERVTHALRSSEYKDREEQFYRILRMHQKVWPSLPDVHVWDYSRLSFVNTVLSKRKLTKLVEIGAVDGWDDPRMPTVQGLIRRGLTVPALREFIMNQGASRMVTYQEWEKLWTFNKKHIDPVCPRHTAVKSGKRVILNLRDVNGPDYVTVPKHKKNPAAGKKITLRAPEIWIDHEDAAVLKEGEEVTLMDWGNAIIESIERDSSGGVTSLQGRTHIEGDVKKTEWKLTWLAKSDDLIPLTLQDFDHLLTKKRLEDDDDILQLLTVCSKWEIDALGDTNMRLLQKGDILQLERKGYFIVDEPYIRPGKPMLLLSIPDGRVKEKEKPAEAVRAAESAAAQRKAKIEAAARQEEAAILKASAPQKENAKASNKKKKLAEEVRQEDVSMNDTPASTKVTVSVEPPKKNHAPSKPPGLSEHTSSEVSQSTRENGSAASPSKASSRPGSDSQTRSNNDASEAAHRQQESLSSSLDSEKAQSSHLSNANSLDTPPGPGISVDSSISPRGSTILKLHKIAEEIVTESGTGSGPSTKGSQPIPVPSPRGTETGSRSNMGGSVPATPANTPQTSFDLPPPRTKAKAEFSSNKTFPTIGLNTKGSVPPTPANTPQRSGELPKHIGLKQPAKSPLGTSDRFSE